MLIIFQHTDYVHTIPVITLNAPLQHWLTYVFTFLHVHKLLVVNLNLPLPLIETGHYGLFIMD